MWQCYIHAYSNRISRKMDIVAGFYMFLSLLSLDFFLLSLVAFFTYAPYRQHKVVGTWKIRHWFGKNAVANTNKKNENVNLLEMKAAFEQQQKYHNGIHRDRILRMTSILVDTSICVTRWNVQYVYLKPTKWNAQWSICSAIYTMLIIDGWEWRVPAEFDEHCTICKIFRRLTKWYADILSDNMSFDVQFSKRLWSLLNS